MDARKTRRRRKGFVFDEERQAAVRMFGAIRRAGERYDPDEVYVWDTTNGFKPKDADRLRARGATPEIAFEPYTTA